MQSKENEGKHLYFMSLAIEQASLALQRNEVPVGAVLVDGNEAVISKAYNKIEILKCQTAHAEVIAIEDACKKRGDWRLDGCKIYITLEPCLMCFGLIQLSRLDSVFYGAKSQSFGFGLDNGDGFPIYKKDLFVQGGIKAEDSIALLQDFFKEKRIIKKR